jgi:Na+/proline symporter
MSSHTLLQWPDYLVLAAFLVISLGIGFYHSVTGGRQRTTQEFIMANRRLGVLPTAMSLFVSFQSAILILGATAEMYLFGIQFWVWATISFCFALILTDRLMIPWIYPLKLVSINDVS